MTDLDRLLNELQEVQMYEFSYLEGAKELAPKIMKLKESIKSLKAKIQGDLKAHAQGIEQ